LKKKADLPIAFSGGGIRSITDIGGVVFPWGGLHPFQRGLQHPFHGLQFLDVLVEKGDLFSTNCHYSF